MQTQTDTEQETGRCVGQASLAVQGGQQTVAANTQFLDNNSPPCLPEGEESLAPAYSIHFETLPPLLKKRPQLSQVPLPGHYFHTPPIK